MRRDFHRLAEVVLQRSWVSPCPAGFFVLVRHDSSNAVKNYLGELPLYSAMLAPFLRHLSAVSWPSFRPMQYGAHAVAAAAHAEAGGHSARSRRLTCLRAGERPLCSAALRFGGLTGRRRRAAFLDSEALSPKPV